MPPRRFSWLQSEGPCRGPRSEKTWSAVRKTALFGSKQENEIKAAALQVLISVGEMSKQWKLMWVSLI